MKTIVILEFLLRIFLIYLSEIGKKKRLKEKYELDEVELLALAAQAVSIMRDHAEKESLKANILENQLESELLNEKTSGHESNESAPQSAQPDSAVQTDKPQEPKSDENF